MVKNHKNGKIRQLTAEQQLMLRTIQARQARYEANAATIKNQAQEQANILMQQAGSCQAEYNKLLQEYMQRLGIDVNSTNWDNDKLQFIPKPSAPADAEQKAAETPA